MSIEAWLAEAEKPETGGGGEFVTIAKVKCYFCFQGWTSGQSQLFEFEVGDTEAEAKAKAECEAYINSGVNDYDQWPQKGICTHIDGSDVPTNAEGKFHWGDIEDFVKKYESDASKGNLTEEELGKVAGTMPFTLVMEGLANNPVMAGGKWQWVKLSQEINQWAKAKGKKNKKGYDLRVHVLRHVYASKAEAKKDAEAIKAGKATSQLQAPNGLSAKALEAWGSLEAFRDKKDEIENTVQNAIKGIGSAKMTPAQARAYAAEGYLVEDADLTLIGIDESPF